MVLTVQRNLSIIAPVFCKKKKKKYLLSASCAVDVNFAKRVLTVGVFGSFTDRMKTETNQPQI